MMRNVTRKMGTEEKGMGEISLIAILRFFVVFFERMLFVYCILRKNMVYLY